MMINYYNINDTDNDDITNKNKTNTLLFVAIRVTKN